MYCMAITGLNRNGELEIHETTVPTQWTPLPVKMDDREKRGVGLEGGASPGRRFSHGAGRRLY